MLSRNLEKFFKKMFKIVKNKKKPMIQVLFFVLN